VAAIAKPLTEFPLLSPPPRRWRGPIADAHMHAKDVESMRAYWDVAERLYGVTHAVVIADLATSRELRRAFGPRVEPAVWGIFPRKDNLKDWTQFRKDKEAHLEQIAAEGFKIVKLWFTPRFHEWSNLRLDDPALDFFFDRLNRLRLAILIHVADPDQWFAHRINDLEQHGAKAEHYLQLVTRLEQYPELRVQAAHFGGHPEDLDHLSDLLERFPNLVLDSSATKWVAREFSTQGERARAFLIRHADRVLFGTDLVADPQKEKEGKQEHYASRFYVHQLMWEQRGQFDSPIEDDDAADTPRFQGLDLPDDVLAKFYWENAARLYGLTPVPPPRA
jgi:predicted TIM-barrel fold metal-dependent hydrolase